MAANDKDKDKDKENACRVCEQSNGNAAPQCKICNGGGTGGGVQASNLVSIAAYNYSAKTLIKSNDTNIVFYPSKRIDKAAPFTYTICDSNKSVSPRQVTVNALGVISSKLGGTC